jgi:anti-sigma regulatory factor (Ser/Thr protein kinase)
MMRVAVSDTSATFEARRGAVELASHLQFHPDSTGELALLVTEAATNLLKHAGGGEIFIREVFQLPRSLIEVVAIDRGPGIPNMSECLEDGYSTVGTLGGGFGAMRRFSHAFDVYSMPGKGTALYARVQAGRGDTVQMTSSVEVGGLSVPVAGETECGDIWGHKDLSGAELILICDGLGHGPEAARAARLALELFQETSLSSPAEMIEFLHSGLKSTRGAAAAVALIEPAEGRLTYAGLGNTSGVILSGSGRRHLISYNGIVGHQASRIQELQYPWLSGSVLVLHTDGLSGKWDLDKYPGLIARHPGLVAATLYRDFARSHDDASVVVARERLS